MNAKANRKPAARGATPSPGWAAGLVIGVLGLALLSAWALWQPDTKPEAATSWQALLSGPVQGGREKPPSAELAAPGQSAQSTPAVLQFDSWLTQESSLRGAVLDGSWGQLDAQGRLRPALEVRRRFDQLLTLVGERPLPDISAYVQAQSVAALGPEGGAQVEALWRQYLALQQEPLRNTVDLNDRRTWAAAQAERQAHRVRYLGFEWARAFYEAEERIFATLMQSPAAAGPSTLVDPNTLNPEQRARWQQAQAETADWERRLAQARQHWAQLQSQPQWSAPQRLAQMQAHLQAHFSEDERRRVRALLDLPD